MIRRVALVLVLLAAAFSIVWSALAAPRVLPRLRVAPGFGLVDATGQRLSSDALRGQVVLVTFGPAACDDRCREWSRLLAERLVAVRSDRPVTYLWIVTDPVDPAELGALAGTLDASLVPWRVLGSSEQRELDLVLAGFRVPRPTGGATVDPVLIVVDPAGIVRAEYRTAPATRALASDLEALERELRESRGVRRYLYEAAHLFTCNVGGV
ncbi:MAG: SCO family protein [Thermomicrobium sp.]|nr:SCO family protein [Thermomicrobium sp.]